MSLFLLVFKGKVPRAFLSPHLWNQRQFSVSSKNQLFLYLPSRNPEPDKCVVEVPHQCQFILSMCVSDEHLRVQLMQDLWFAFNIQS
jgi:hypothetical protein